MRKHDVNDKLELLMVYDGKIVKMPLKNYLLPGGEEEFKKNLLSPEYCGNQSDPEIDCGNLFIDEKASDCTVCNSLKECCSILREDLIRNGQERTARAYFSALNRFIGFVKNKNISLEEIDGYVIKKYENYLLEEGLQMNTVSFYIRNLRVIYNKAVNQGLASGKNENIFINVFTGVHETRRRSLEKKIYGETSAYRK